MACQARSFGVADEEQTAPPAAGRWTRTRSRRGLLSRRRGGSSAGPAVAAAAGGGLAARRRGRPVGVGAAAGVAPVQQGAGAALAAQAVAARRWRRSRSAPGRGAAGRPAGGRSVVVGVRGVVVVGRHGGDVPPPGRDGITMRSDRRRRPRTLRRVPGRPGTNPGRLASVMRATVADLRRSRRPMANERLRTALLQRGVTPADLADTVGVDPKTIERWIGGRIPYRRHRHQVAAQLGVDETYLWPGALAARPGRVGVGERDPRRPPAPLGGPARHLGAALRLRRARRSASWSTAGMFLADDPGMLALFRAKADAGRADPDPARRPRLTRGRRSAASTRASTTRSPRRSAT